MVKKVLSYILIFLGIIYIYNLIKKNVSKIRAIYELMKILFTVRYEGNKYKGNWTYADLWEELLIGRENELLFIDITKELEGNNNEKSKWTRLDIDKFANKVAYTLNDTYNIQSINSNNNNNNNTTLGLMIHNCAEYVGVWIGASKIGITTALVNCNITGDALLHCLQKTVVSEHIYELSY